MAPKLHLNQIHFPMHTKWAIRWIDGDLTDTHERPVTKFTHSASSWWLTMHLHSSGSTAQIIYGFEGSYSGRSRERIKRASITRYGSTPSLYKMS